MIFVLETQELNFNFLLMGIFSPFFCCLLIFSKNSFRNTIRVSNSFDPDQGQQNVRPDLLQSYRQTALGDKELNVPDAKKPDFVA